MKNIGSYPNVRLRRNRKTEWSRRLVRENNLSSSDLIWPIFIREGKNVKEPIKSMPGVYRYTIDKIESLVQRAINKKIPMIALFPHTPDSKKNLRGTEALNKNNLVCKALRLIKKNYKEIGLMCDVALDPYTSHGHDGILEKENISAEVIDLRTLYPLDRETIITSVNKTKRALVLSESYYTSSVPSEITSIIFENCYKVLKKPVIRHHHPLQW